MDTDRASEQVQVVVIGAGQAGLSVGYCLAAHHVSFVILESQPRIGDSWRQRWDSLRLYSPAMRDGLPGMAFPASPTTYPTAAEMESGISRIQSAVTPPTAAKGTPAKTNAESRGSR